MKALKEHVFFKDISWETLWTLPAPPLEPGLVKKMDPPVTGRDNNWEDVGATWDDMVGNDSTSSLDEIEWAPDADQSMVIRQSRLNGYRSSTIPSPVVETELSPEGRSDVLRQIHELPSQVLEDDSETIIDGKLSPERMRTVSLSEPMDVPNLRPPNANTERRGSMSTGSPTSSSDGGTLEGLNEQMQALELERGRSRAETPVQGNGPVLELNWYVSSTSVLTI
jgi:3-phosphoinositide dependent protein kinase-1